MSETPGQQAPLSKAGPMGMLGGVLGLILFAVGYVGATTPDAKRVVMESYTYAYIFWASLTLGCLGLMLLHHTIRARWGLPVLRLLEAGGGPVSIALMALLFIPIGLNLAMHSPETVYLWARPMAEPDHVLEGKAFYLNVPFFIGRQVAYFAIWFLFASFLRNSSLKQDKNLDPNESAKRTNVSAPGLVLFFIIITGAVTDWVMSLEPHWYSTVLPLLFAVGCALSALSLMVMFVLMNRASAPYKSVINPNLTKDLGNMLFALTCLWTYLTISQYLIIWSGNLPEEIPYYIARSSATGWNYLGLIVVVGQFFVPFLVLLAPRTKAYAKNLAVIAAVIFLVRFFDMYWTVMPGLRSSMGGSLGTWTDYAALIGVGGVWFAVWGAQVKKGALLPAHDRRLEDVAHA